MKITLRDMIEMAMLIAIAVILDMPFLKIRIGLNGGSISLTMITLVIMALRMGPLKSLIGCGLIYGFITCLSDGWGLECFPFDYLIGYGSICLCGFFKPLIFKNKKLDIFYLILCGLISFFGRMIGSTISSLVLWEYSLVPALIYNVVYIGPSALATIVGLILLYPPLLEINKRHPSKSIC